MELKNKVKKEAIRKTYRTGKDLINNQIGIRDYDDKERIDNSTDTEHSPSLFNISEALEYSSNI